MGRVRTKSVKVAAVKLMNAFSGQFTANFDENKQSLKERAEIPTKRLRNKIAGYITKKVRTSED